MAYWTMIFNQSSIDVVDEKKLITAITESNFHTLCAQYGLESALIEPALMNLSVVSAGGQMLPLFMVQYQPEGKRAVMVYRWEGKSANGRRLLKHANEEIKASASEELLSQTHQIMGIELAKGQLQDMGLLLAYELARWAAYEGGGIIRGIDGVWYRLNRHKAFIPLSDD